MKDEEDARLTKEEAKKMVIERDDNMVHTFLNTPIGLIGADHSKESIYEDIDKAFLCKKTGKMAQEMGHGLVILPREKCKQDELLFVETNELRKTIND